MTDGAQYEREKAEKSSEVPTPPVIEAERQQSIAAGIKARQIAADAAIGQLVSLWGLWSSHLLTATMAGLLRDLERTSDGKS